MEDSSEVQVKGLLGSTIKQACEALAEPVSLNCHSCRIATSNLSLSFDHISGVRNIGCFVLSFASADFNSD